MKKKPVDPLLALAKHEAIWTDAGVIGEGLPGGRHWRMLDTGEQVRTGDYRFVDGVWQLVIGEGPVVGRTLRPMGDCRVLFIGPSLVSPQYRTGEPDKPYATLDEAIATLSEGQPYRAYQVGNPLPIAWRDPDPRYLETAGETPQVVGAQAVREEILTDNLQDLLDHPGNFSVEAVVVVPDTELREHISPQEAESEG